MTARSSRGKRTPEIYRFSDVSSKASFHRQEADSESPTVDGF